ncbi:MULTISPECIES: histidine phosphatase family protein [Planktothrix]|nr:MULTISPECIES: histidine phosphatase family protein [Planktothrix]CAD5984228.1 Phosphoserine phosphatase 1 [Planktothrix rubescens]CAD5984539.1 Phosphoserine phosphatase 1 [Planktothrix agardhii]CAH2575730.1 Phosphoserine phosphatase 1 [Planktothrix rubescens]
MSLTFYFLCHGETIHSREGRYCGALESELTPEAQEMVNAFVLAYQSIPWETIYISPMKHALATAKPLADAVGVQMQFRSGLKEMDFGVFEDKSYEWVKEHHSESYGDWMTNPAWNSPKKGETSVEVASRSMLVISEIREKYKNGNVLVVSHKTTIQIMLCSFLGIDLGRYLDRLDILAGSVSQVKFGIHGPLLQKLGDRSYLVSESESQTGT